MDRILKKKNDVREINIFLFASKKKNFYERFYVVVFFIIFLLYKFCEKKI